MPHGFALLKMAREGEAPAEPQPKRSRHLPCGSAGASPSRKLPILKQAKALMNAVLLLSNRSLSQMEEVKHQYIIRANLKELIPLAGSIAGRDKPDQEMEPRVVPVWGIPIPPEMRRDRTGSGVRRT